MDTESSKLSGKSLISRRRDNTSGSLEVISPDLSSSNQEDFNLSIEVDDYETDSDLNSEECWDSDGGNHRDKYTDGRTEAVKPGLPQSQTVGLERGRELVPFHNDDGVEVDSDEERDIMKEIRAEIENQVRADMKDELVVYQKKMEYLERDAAGETTHRDDQAERTETDPKLKAAILKMKKLDRILSKKIKKEKEVKRDRFLLQKRLREELAQIKPDGRDDTKEVKANMERFLMLALPPSHNEGVDLAEEEEGRPVSPVFHTQLNETDFEDRCNRRVGTETGHERSANSSAGSTKSSATSKNQNDDEKLKQKNLKKRTKDFIKRNKQLAGDADNPIPMTDDEKKRINDLLGDLDSIPDLPDNMDVDHVTSSAWTSENPFQLSIHSGEGFLPEPDEKCTLERIDSQLRTLLPAEEFVAFRTTSYTPDRQRVMATQAAILSGSEAEFDRLGEKALQEKRDERDLQTRLRRIEEELSRLHNPAFDMELDSPRLSEEGLHNLIDQCVYSLSRSSVLSSQSGQETPGSECPSSRLSLLENPPKLDEEVLQRLLTEARASVHSSRTTTDRDSVNDVRNHHFTKELGIEAITSNTWDVINSTELSDEDTPVPHEDSSYRLSNAARDGEFSRFGGQHEETGTLSRLAEEDMSRFRTDTPLSIQSYRESDNFDVTSSRASSVNRNSRTPFLPEISNSPCLVSQGASLANSMMSDPDEGIADRNRRSVNSRTGSRGQSEMSGPRPPTSERPQNASQNTRSRSITSPPQDL